MIEDHNYQCIQMMDHQCQEDDDQDKGPKENYSTFINSLMADDGIDQKNLLLEIVYREITDKGNYLSIEGKSLSV